MRNLLVPFSLSLLINASAIFSLNQAVTVEQARMVSQAKKLAHQKEDKLQFEFVEAPAKSYPQKPKNTRRISDRDALSQDQTSPKSSQASLPKLPKQGPANQLEQIRTTSNSTPSVLSKPEKPSPEDKPAEENKKKEGEKEAVISKDEAWSQAKEPSPDSKPSPPNPGLTGQDMITAQAMSRTVSMGAQIQGVTSFEATGSGMGEYMKRLKEKIWLAWFPNIAFKYPQDFKGADAVIGFILDKKGDVKIMKVVKSSGSPLFATFCLDAVQRASGFGNLPEEIMALLGKEEIEISFSFYYR